ncbi:MAG: hypothetical protein ABI884_13315 [Gemmatimonadota bacterium]
MSLKSLASNRLAAFFLAVTLGSALACYGDKPGTGAAKGPQATGSGLGLSPLPATHDTALREVDNFALNTDLINRWSLAKRGMDSITVANPGIVKTLKSQGVPSGIAEMGSRIEAVPELGSALKQAHIDGHTYMLTTIALQQAIHGYQLKQTGKLAQLTVPPVILSNIDFVSGHLPQVMQAMRGPARTMPGLPH